MTLIKFTAVLIIVSFSTTALAQNKAEIAGTWKGSSICQIKDSPCHDEIAVYHVFIIEGTDSLRFVMNKIVNNIEEEMGTTIFYFDAGKQTLVSKDPVRNADWNFHAEGKQMKGTLVYKNRLYRVVDLRKQD